MSRLLQHSSKTRAESSRLLRSDEDNKLSEPDTNHL